MRNGIKTECIHRIDWKRHCGKDGEQLVMEDEVIWGRRGLPLNPPWCWEHDLKCLEDTSYSLWMKKWSLGENPILGTGKHEIGCAVNSRGIRARTECHNDDRNKVWQKVGSSLLLGSGEHCLLPVACSGLNPSQSISLLMSDFWQLLLNARSECNKASLICDPSLGAGPVKMLGDGCLDSGMPASGNHLNLLCLKN